MIKGLVLLIFAFPIMVQGYTLNEDIKETRNMNNSKNITKELPMGLAWKKKVQALCDALRLKKNADYFCLYAWVGFKRCR